MSVRTTIVLDEDLAQEVRMRAAERGVGLSRMIGDLVKRSLELDRAPSDEPFRLRWQSQRGALLPGVDLADRDRLYDIMEERT
jgi:hypothetical protein